MKVGLNILAIVSLIIGSIWVLQGINLLPGSFMTGQMQWAYRGGILFLFGIILLVFTNRKKK
jgi:hypothetical protein